MSKQRKQPWERGEWVRVGLNIGGKPAWVIGQVFDGTEYALRIYAHRLINRGEDFGPGSDADGRCVDQEVMVFASNIVMVTFLPMAPDWCTCPDDRP